MAQLPTRSRPCMCPLDDTARSTERILPLAWAPIPASLSSSWSTISCRSRLPFQDPRA
jgi:hypothetical protein